MGDRATIVVSEGEQSVSLYTHWRGGEVRDILKTAIGRRQRWKDAPYLARIIFCTMVEGAASDETGFGIWVGEQDGAQYTVDVKAQFVRYPDDHTESFTSLCN